MLNDIKYTVSTHVEESQDSLIESDVSTKNIKKPRFFNATAYRIFKLLLWLVETPLTTQDINGRFLKEPFIGEVLSDDAIRLYISTLRLVGCNIRRPSGKNKFHYELLTHPFGFDCDPVMKDTLQASILLAQENFGYREMQLLESVLNKVLYNSGMTITDTQHMSHTGHGEVAIGMWMEILEKGITQDGLLFLRYLNDSGKEIEFYFFPELLYYESGITYVHGQSLDSLTSKSYRLDSILQIQADDNAILLQELRQRRNEQSQVILRLFVPEPDSWMGLNLDIRHGVYAENIISRSISANPYVEVEYSVRNFTFLKQKLLERYQFKVIIGDKFREDVQRTLTKMTTYY